MGCNSCKSKNGTGENNGENIGALKFTNNIIAKFILWLLACALTVLIIPVAWVMLFNSLILDKGTNIIPSFTKMGNLLKKKGKDDEEEENYESIDDIDPDDYELDNVEVIR